MKRDMDLVRAILLKIEESDGTPNQRLANELEGYDPDLVMYHIGMLSKSGYIEAYDASPASGDYFIPINLTWEGHDFLDAARNDTVWNGVKQEVTKFGGSVPIEVFKNLLITGAAKYFGL